MDQLSSCLINDSSSPLFTHLKGRETPDEGEKLRSPRDSNKIRSTDSNKLTRGVAMSFGFRRRPTLSIASNPTVARRLADMDSNGNTADSEALTNNFVPTSRSTPRLAPPNKEPNSTRFSRFGFRQTQTNKHNKIADLNCSIEYPSTKNGNVLKKSFPVCYKTASSVETENNNNNRMVKVGIQAQAGKFTLQSTNLPRPEPIQLIDTKTAKTLVNDNRKVVGKYQHYEENSSKDGSLTEDSGVGSHLSAALGKLEAGSAIGVRRNSNTQLRSRNLEVVISKNTFDVRDMDDSSDSGDSILHPPLPQLPSAFENSSENKNKSYQSFGLVRERILEYDRHLDWDSRGREVSVTSSEGLSDDYGEEEKTFKETFRSEKTFTKPTPAQQTFLKSRTSQIKGDSSPPSSDEHDWAHGGEAMADEVSFSLSSSDESKDMVHQKENVPISGVIGSAVQSLINGSLAKSFSTYIPGDVKNILLTIEDPKFAAVAAATNEGTLLDDETLISPIESISCSETEVIRKKNQHSSSESKDINEKDSPTSPGSPTNASNSLSLSDGKDDFLIDDEIADQPSLVFEDGLSALTDNTVSWNNSEETPTLIETTHKIKRKVPTGCEGSPLNSRNRKFLQSRTGSLDTLSPCESIASDDLMMDYDYSQSSGLDEFDAFAPKPRLLRSRAGTPNSVAESPRPMDRRTAQMSKPSIANNSAKSRINHFISTGYDSDYSVPLDRVNETAMKQDIISIKTMLLKLRRVLNESETHNPFGDQAVLSNGIFNSPCNLNSDITQEENEKKAKMELAELRRQILFLQGQLEDKEKTVQFLQEQMIKLSDENYYTNSAPASTSSSGNQICNTATQTDRCD